MVSGVEELGNCRGEGEGWFVSSIGREELGELQRRGRRLDHERYQE